MNRLSSPSRYAIIGAASPDIPDLLIHLSEGNTAVQPLERSHKKQGFLPGEAGIDIRWIVLVVLVKNLRYDLYALFSIKIYDDFVAIFGVSTFF